MADVINCLQLNEKTDCKTTVFLKFKTKKQYVI